MDIDTNLTCTLAGSAASGRRAVTTNLGSTNAAKQVCVA